MAMQSPSTIAPYVLCKRRTDAATSAAAGAATAAASLPPPPLLPPPPPPSLEPPLQCRCRSRRPLPKPCRGTRATMLTVYSHNIRGSTVAPLCTCPPCKKQKGLREGTGDVFSSL